MKIIVSLTSWEKRIPYINISLESILNQNLKPDSIELNLAEEEFPNREKSLPTNIQEFLKKHKNIINVNWVYKNTRTFKKIIPTLLKYQNKEDYYIVSIDDDLIYRNDYIEMMVNYIQQYNGDSFCLANCNICGNRTIYKSSAFEKDFIDKLTNEVISYGIDDAYIEYYLSKTGKNMTHFRPDDILDIIKIWKEISPLHDEYRQNNIIQKAQNEIYKIEF